MRANRWDDEFMASAIEAIASRYLESLFEVNIELSMAIDQLKARAVDFQSWAELFVGAKPKVWLLHMNDVQHAYNRLAHCHYKGSERSTGAY